MGSKRLMGTADLEKSTSRLRRIQHLGEAIHHHHGSQGWGRQLLTLGVGGRKKWRRWNEPGTL